MEKKELTVLIDLNELYKVVLNLEAPCYTNQSIYFTIEEDDVYNLFDYKLNFDSMCEDSNRYTPGLFYIGGASKIDYDEAFDSLDDFLEVCDFTEQLNEIYNSCNNKLIQKMSDIDEYINPENEYKITFKIKGE